MRTTSAGGGEQAAHNNVRSLLDRLPQPPPAPRKEDPMSSRSPWDDYLEDEEEIKGWDEADEAGK